MSFFDDDEGQNVTKRFKSNDDMEEDESPAKQLSHEVKSRTLTASCGVADRLLEHQTLRRNDVCDSGRPQYKPLEHQTLRRNDVIDSGRPQCKPLAESQGLIKRSDDRKSSLSKPPLTPHGTVRSVSFAPTVLSSVTQSMRAKPSSAPRRLATDLSAAGLQHASILAPSASETISASGTRGSSSGLSINRGGEELSDVGFSRLVTTGNVTKSISLASSGGTSGNTGVSYNAHKGSSNNISTNNLHMPPPLPRRSQLAQSKDLQGVDSSVQLAIGRADKDKATLFSDYECLNAKVAREKEGIVSAVGVLFRNDSLVSVAKPLMLLFLRLEKVQEALLDHNRIAGDESGEV